MLSELKSDKDLVARPCGCGSLACEHCRNAKAMELREKILSAVDAGRFQGYNYFVTLTTSRNLTPLDTYLNISKKRGVSEFKRRLGVEDQVEVKECHKDTYLHYHLICSFPEKLDYKQLYDSGLLKSAWPYGRVNFSFIKDIKRAASYITKYITFSTEELKKGSKHEFADWILNLSHFRFFSTSRGLFGETHRKKNYESEKCDRSEVKEYKKTRSIKDRIKDCCKKVSFFNRLGEFVKTVCIPFEDFLKLKPLYNRRYELKENWRSAKAFYYISSDCVEWLASAVERLRGSPYVSDSGSVHIPFHLPRSSDADWLLSCENRWANDCTYHKDFWGRDTFCYA